MQDTVMSMKRQRRGEKSTVSTKVRSSLQGVVHRRSSKRMREVGELIQPICTVRWDDTVKCADSAGIEEERKEEVTKLLKILSNYYSSYHCITNVTLN